MKLPKSITYQDLTFQQDEYDKYIYTVGSKNKQSEPHVLFALYPDEKQFVLYNIQNNGKTKELTKKTLEAITSQFEIEQITISTITNEITNNLIEDDKEYTQIDQIPNYQQSVFFKYLSQFGYTNIRIEINKTYGLINSIQAIKQK